MTEEQETEEPVTPPAPTEYRLLIEFIFEHRLRFIPALWRRMRVLSILDRLRLYRKFRHRYPVQGVLAEYGLRIRNIGTETFPGGSFRDLTIKHEDANIAVKSMGNTTRPISSLAPGESIDIWVANTIFNIPGPIWITCGLSSSGGNVHTVSFHPKGATRFRPNGATLKC